MSATTEIVFMLNGAERRVGVPSTMSTLEMLRDMLGFTGTKYGCGEGECGACTILVDGASVNSCLMFAVDYAGRQVTTIEGLANDPCARVVQDSFVKHGAVQCGFCTPGMVVQSVHLLATHPHPDELSAQRAIEGNICRCTGYKKIVDAIVDAGCAVGDRS